VQSQAAPLAEYLSSANRVGNLLAAFDLLEAGEEPIAPPGTAEAQAEGKLPSPDSRPPGHVRPRAPARA